jgi:hypothetical protein
MGKSTDLILIKAYEHTQLPPVKGSISGQRCGCSPHVVSDLELILQGFSVAKEGAREKTKESPSRSPPEKKNPSGENRAALQLRATLTS